mgnify:CR=1 FL=1
MMRVLRAIVIAEVITANRIGALCDQWAASAALRLGKLSAKIQHLRGLK